MNSEGGGIRSERGAIRVRDGDGSWWAGPSSPFVVVRAGVASSLLAVLVVRRSTPVVVRSLSFVRFASLASGIARLGRRAVDGTSRPLPLGGRWWPRRISLEGSDGRGGVLTHSLSMTTTTPSSSSSASSTLPRRLPGAREFVRGSVDRGPRASSIRGRWWSLAGCVGSGPRSRILVVVVRRS